MFEKDYRIWILHNCDVEMPQSAGIQCKFLIYDVQCNGDSMPCLSADHSMFEMLDMMKCIIILIHLSTVCSFLICIPKKTHYTTYDTMQKP